MPAGLMMLTLVIGSLKPEKKALTAPLKNSPLGFTAFFLLWKDGWQNR
ncbi:hypothetical protein V1498_03740 [Peribacillus sp. SCS-26]